MDVVYPIKNTSDNDYIELKYSLRGLMNIKHDRVIIVGGKPSWIKNIIHIDGDDDIAMKGLSSLRKIMAALEIVSEDFILMNDDFFLLKPQSLMYYHQGKLKENVDWKGPVLKHSRYWQDMERTSKLFEDPLDYELHYPFLFNKHKFLEMTKKYDMTNPYSFSRSLYGNEYGIGGEYMKDNKALTLEAFKGDLFVSSSDQIPVDRVFLDILDSYLPCKSIYEE